MKHTACAACGAKATPTKGAILARLYPDGFMCSRCGRRTLHCDCEYSPGVSAASLPLRATVPDNGGVKPTTYRGPNVSLPDSPAAA